MNSDHHSKPAYRKLIPGVILLCICAFCSSPALANSTSDHGSRVNLNTGYSALKLLLQDEQYLSIIRRTKAVLMFNGISEPSKQLVDDIADTSEMALEQLYYLSSYRPAIRIEEFPEDSIIMATFDSMRTTTVKELLFVSDDFEKSLLISQAQVLRVISHLISQIEQHEPNNKRREWLGKLAERYEAYYRRVYTRIRITQPHR